MLCADPLGADPLDAYLLGPYLLGDYSVIENVPSRRGSSAPSTVPFS